MLKSKSNFKTLYLERILISLIYLFLAFSLPWWLVIVVGLFLVFYFNNFYEFIVAGIILDILYGGIVTFEGFSFLFTLLTTISIIVLIRFKERLFL